MPDWWEAREFASVEDFAASARRLLGMPQLESFVCPDCEMESFSVWDRIYGYCGNCHAFTGDQAYVCGAAFCDDPACATHSHLREK